MKERTTATARWLDRLRKHRKKKGIDNESGEECLIKKRGSSILSLSTTMSGEMRQTERVR